MQSIEGSRYDLVIVGGGINGAGVARDAAGRGMKVLLCEQDDLAAHTSSASTKLIHGGLRYLEYHEYRLVREALREREVLHGIAPHVIWPLRFVLPHVRDLRPAWMIRMGLWLYDRLGGRGALPGSRGIDLRTDPRGQPLDPGLRRAFVYSDCWVQDARLVVLNCMDAARLGATILPRTRCTRAERVGSEWHIGLVARADGAETAVRARALVNAAGPWVEEFLARVSPVDREAGLHLVKGSHIVVPRHYDHDDAYIFQHSDGRVVFAIPFEEDFTLIGTTDVPCEGDPAAVTATAEEIDYLCAAVNRYFHRPVRAQDVVWSFAGVRALYDEEGDSSAPALSRDYALELDAAGPPLLSVFGGKVTTYRKLAGAVLQRLSAVMAVPGSDWTGNQPLPGGQLPERSPAVLEAELQREYPQLPRELLARWVRHYGSETRTLLGATRTPRDLGTNFGAGLYEAELRYLHEHEWARTADDVLWRRTKLGLRLDADQVRRVEAWFTTAASHGL